MQRCPKWMLVAVAAVTATGCARRSTPKAPGKVGDAEIVRTVMIIDPYGLAGEPQLESVTSEPGGTEPASASASPPLDDTMFDCTVDVQCTIVDYGCGAAPPVSVNRDDAETLRSRMQERTCDPATAAANAECAGGDCEVHRLAVCDHRKCARLEFHIMGDTFTRVSVVHNRFTRAGDPR